MLVWLCFVYPWLCVSRLVPYSLGNHAQLGGGSVAERLRSTLALWLGGTLQRRSWLRNSFHKISILVYVTSAILFTVNEYNEHVECLYEQMFASTV